MGTTCCVEQKVAELVEGQSVGYLRHFVTFCDVRRGAALVARVFEHELQRSQLPKQSHDAARKQLQDGVHLLHGDARQVSPRRAGGVQFYLGHFPVI